MASFGLSAKVGARPQSISTHNAAMHTPTSSAPASPLSAQPVVLAKWHAFAAAQDPKGLQGLVADDAVFHSPVVHTP
jgi:hypothetical protein